MRVIVIVLALAGCGRLDFDPLGGVGGDDGGGTGGDGGSTDGSAVDARPFDVPFPGLCGSFFPCGTSSMGTSCGTLCVSSCSDPVDRATARTKCQGWGGDLVSIHDPAEQSCVDATFIGTSWIGFQQADGAANPVAAWTWSDGSSNAFMNWGGGSPNDADGTESNQEQCAQVQTGGGWADAGCGQLAGFVCARPL